ncbi:DUF3619 family protein [Gammaproteobacteria bacterium]|jgi:hypothetical protein|nr:DUF3619 family protein [Gammaproteobacteria bacterium]
MNQKKSDQRFTQEIKQELDSSCDRLDAQTLSRLTHIRHQALEGKLEGKNSFFYQRLFNQNPLLSSSAIAACMLVLGIGFYFNMGVGASDITLSELEDIEILSADDSFELYDDIEFYQWLSMNDDF